MQLQRLPGVSWSSRKSNALKNKTRQADREDRPDNGATYCTVQAKDSQKYHLAFSGACPMSGPWVVSHVWFDRIRTSTCRFPAPVNLLKSTWTCSSFTYHHHHHCIGHCFGYISLLQSSSALNPGKLTSILSRFCQGFAAVLALASWC